MTKGTVFWLLMILVAFFGGWWRWSDHPYSMWGFGLVLFALLFLLGWHNFGFVIH